MAGDCHIVENEAAGPRPGCLLVIKEHIQHTAKEIARETADAVQAMLSPWISRVEKLDASVRGNGRPGLADEVRVLKQAHDDSVKLRRTIFGYLGVHAAVLIAAIISIVLWYGKVEAHMKQTDRYARIELHGSAPAILKTESGQTVVIQPGSNQ